MATYHLNAKIMKSVVKNDMLPLWTLASVSPLPLTLENIYDSYRKGDNGNSYDWCIRKLMLMVVSWKECSSSCLLMYLKKQALNAIVCIKITCPKERVSKFVKAHELPYATVESMSRIPCPQA